MPVFRNELNLNLLRCLDRLDRQCVFCFCPGGFYGFPLCIRECVVLCIQYNLYTLDGDGLIGLRRFFRRAGLGGFRMGHRKGHKGSNRARHQAYQQVVNDISFVFELWLFSHPNVNVDSP